MEGELCVCEITTALKRPQSTTSHHLSILRDAGLIKERKVGKWSNYRLGDGAVIEMMNLARLLRGDLNINADPPVDGVDPSDSMPSNAANSHVVIPVMEGYSSRRQA